MEVEGGKSEAVTNFIFLDCKITADGDCSHEIERCFLFGRRSVRNIDNILKSRYITLPTKIYVVKAMVFPPVMYRCDSWIIKKAEYWRIDAIELWCFWRFLRVPCTARRSNQWILEEINNEYSLKGPLLKLQYFGHLLQRADSLEKTPMLGKTEGYRRRGQQRIRLIRWHHWLSRHEFEQTPGDSGGQRSLACCSPWGRNKLNMA